MTAPGSPWTRLSGAIAAMSVVGLAAGLDLTAQQPPVVAQQDPVLAAPAPGDQAFQEARQAFDAGNYEAARELLDAVIARLSSGPSDVVQRQVLAASYELRGRTRISVRDNDGARADFRAMLLVDPGYLLPAEAGPRAQTLFDDVRKTTVGDVEIRVTPPDANITLDGVRLLERPNRLTLVGGTHTIAARRSGHRASEQSFTVVPGGPAQTIELVLDREFSTVTLMTTPPNVEVLVDGTSRGVTEADTGAEAAGGTSAAASSRPFVVDDLLPGRHRIEFKRECFTPTEQNVDIARPDDLRLDPVQLVPAVASVSITGDVAGGTVFVDDASRGPAPQVLTDICQGPHTIEVRTRSGRSVKRLNLSAGQTESFVAQVRPAFAIVSDGSVNDGARDASDLRLATETAFRESTTMTLFVSPDKRTADLFTANELAADWLAFDALRRPFAGAAKVPDSVRRDIGTRVAGTLDAQGIAAVARDPGGDRSDMLLILLAPGSARPDVVRWRQDNVGSIRQAIARLDDLPQVTRASLGLSAIDVIDIQGAVVTRVDAGGSAAAAGIQPGETVTGAGGMPVTGAGQLLAIVNAHPAGEALPLEVKNRAGTARNLDVTAQQVPRLIDLHDQSVLSNALAVHYLSRAASPASPVVEAAVRLNLAASLMRLENWNDATRELESVAKLAAGGALSASVKDAVGGTAQYLLGACAEATGDVQGAERAWGLAAQSRSAMLTDSADPLKEISERRLAQLRQAQGLAP